ncbi:MAG: hypothetical protein PHD95_03305 [Candidatus ainarchaeum sp.]|nr:hypothetical protein [Candidatus ainarchaeum sp.]
MPGFKERKKARITTAIKKKATREQDISLDTKQKIEDAISKINSWSYEKFKRPLSSRRLYQYLSISNRFKTDPATRAYVNRLCREYGRWWKERSRRRAQEKQVITPRRAENSGSGIQLD